MRLSRLIAWLIVASLLNIASASAQDTAVTWQGRLVPLGFCALAVTTTVSISTCTGGIPARASTVYLNVETNAMRWRDDGTAPTASVGMPVGVGQQLIYYGTPLSALNVVAQTGTSNLDITFYGPSK